MSVVPRILMRYLDVILPKAPQPRYSITEEREEPQYDYCSCDVCRGDFEKETGIDPLKFEDPVTSQDWRRFRYDKITDLVKRSELKRE